jgi:hypothetical protein
LLLKTIEFKNIVGQKIKVVEIPVLERNNPYYFMIQAHLQMFMSSLYKKPQEKSCFSFREHVKRKMSWPDFNDIFSIHAFRNNA